MMQRVVGASQAIAAIVVLSAMIHACSSTPPHQNYIQLLTSSVGYKLGGSGSPLWLQSMTDKQRLLSIEPVDNAHDRYRFRYSGSCVAMFDVENSESTIVAARIEGSEKDCVLVP